MLRAKLSRAIISSSSASRNQPFPPRAVSGSAAKAYCRLLSQMPYLTHHCGSDAEPIHRYRPGGYHPVRLGDTFQDGRYRILHKISWGGYSTIWAARDQMENRYVAIKIAVSETSNREVRILQQVSSIAGEHPGRAHLLQLLDKFTVAGPNGTHNCLVLELAGPNLPDFVQHVYPEGRLPGPLAKVAAKQVLLGIDFLATHNIGHGDLHARNLVYAIPNLNSLDDQQFFDRFGKPETAPVTRTADTLLESHMPSYLVRPASFSVDLCETLKFSPVVKIIDFGESFPKDEAPITLHTPLVVRAPEVIFGDQIDHNVDLWSMGCLLFQLVTGQPPFDATMLSPATLVSQMMERATDDMPERWQERWQLMGTGVPTNDAPRSLRKWLQDVYYYQDRCSEFTKQDIDNISELVGRMLKFEPSSRVGAGQILNDPWFQ